MTCASREVRGSGKSGLVVQGKAIALQLVETLCRAAPGAELTQFAHRSSWAVARRRPLHSRCPGRSARGSLKEDRCEDPAHDVAVPSARGNLIGPDRARQDAYLNRPIRLVVPYPAGGTADAMARALGQEISRPGAAGRGGELPRRRHDRRRRSTRRVLPPTAIRCYSRPHFDTRARPAPGPDIRSQ